MVSGGAGPGSVATRRTRQGVDDLLAAARTGRGLVVVLAVVAGLALRVWILRSDFGVIDADEAVGGLIARDFLHGHVAVFLWGARHGGTLEGLLTAVVFVVTGTSTVAAKLVPVALHAAACVVVWRIGRRTVGRWPATLAGCLMWVFPPSYVLSSTKARLYYSSSLLLATLILLVVLRLARWGEEPAASVPTDGPLPRRDVVDLLGMGLLLGLALWTAVFAFYVTVAVGGWLVVRRHRLVRHAWLLAPGVVLGGLPWWVYNLAKSFASFDEPAIPDASSYPDRVQGAFTHILPSLLGLREPGSTRWYGGDVLGPLLTVLLALVVVGWAVASRRRTLPLLIALAGFPLLFAVPQSSSYVNEPRYGLCVVPVFVLLLAGAIGAVARRPAAGAAVVLAATAVTGLTLGSIQRWTERLPGQWDVISPPIGPLVAELDRTGTELVWTDYWISYRLTFETDTRIIASPVDFVRHEPYASRVAEDPETTFAFFLGSGKDQGMQEGMARLGTDCARTEAAPYVVYRCPIRISPAELPEVQFR